MGYHERLGCLTVEALSGALRLKNAVDEALKASAEISLGRYRDGCHRRRVVIQIGKGIDIAYLAHQAATPRTHECQHQRKSMKKEYQPMLATLVGIDASLDAFIDARCGAARMA
jgi:hypothetical protein